MNDYLKIAEYFQNKGYDIDCTYVVNISKQILREYELYKMYATLKKRFKLDDFVDLDAVFNKHNWNIVNPIEGFSTNSALRQKQLYNLLFIRVKNSLIKPSTEFVEPVKEKYNTGIWQDIDILISTNFTKEEEASLLNGDPLLLNYLKELVKEYGLTYKRINKRQLIIC